MDTFLLLCQWYESKHIEMNWTTNEKNRIITFVDTTVNTLHCSPIYYYSLIRYDVTSLIDSGNLLIIHVNFNDTSMYLIVIYILNTIYSKLNIIGTSLSKLLL